MSAIKTRAKAQASPMASGPRVGALLTVAELVAAIVAAGMDPDITTIAVDHEEVRAQSEDWRLGNGHQVHFTGGCRHEMED